MPYVIQRTAPTVYLDQTGAAVNGFKVTVYLSQFDETHFINVPSLDPAVVTAEADKLEKNRAALAALSQPQEVSKSK